MISKDDLVQQLLELDADIAAAMQRQQANEREARIWSSGDRNRESAVLTGNTGIDASRSIQRLREQRETLARQIESLPDFE